MLQEKNLKRQHINDPTHHLWCLFFSSAPDFSNTLLPSPHLYFYFSLTESFHHSGSFSSEITGTTSQLSPSMSSCVLISQWNFCHRGITTPRPITNPATSILKYLQPENDFSLFSLAIDHGCALATFQACLLNEWRDNLKIHGPKTKSQLFQELI